MKCKIAPLFILIGIALIPAIGFSQTTRKIQGEILSEESSPIPGLAVIQLGTENAVVTDMNGQFELIVDEDQEIYVQLSGLDLEIYMKYSEADAFKTVSLRDWKQIKKENRKILSEWRSKDTKYAY